MRTFLFLTHHAAHYERTQTEEQFRRARRSRKHLVSAQRTTVHNVLPSEECARTRDYYASRTDSHDWVPVEVVFNVIRVILTTGIVIVCVVVVIGKMAGWGRGAHVSVATGRTVDYRKGTGAWTGQVLRAGNHGGWLGVHGAVGRRGSGAGGGTTDGGHAGIGLASEHAGEGWCRRSGFGVVVERRQAHVCREKILF